LGVKSKNIYGGKNPNYRRGKNPQEMKTSSWEMKTSTSQGGKNYLWRGKKSSETR
jgi:D-tyrosyl-tRNA(Tyr) deacylase